jgi:hypothetical protein
LKAIPMQIALTHPLASCALGTVGAMSALLALGACSAADDASTGAGGATSAGTGGSLAITGGASGLGGSGGVPIGGGGTGGLIITETPKGSGGASCAGVSVAAEARVLPTDVVWAIDTSGSMIGSFPAIQEALNRFSADITAANIDVRIVLLAGAGLCVPQPVGSGQCGQGIGLPFPVPGAAGKAPDTREPAFLHLDTPFGSTQGMAVLLDNYAGYAPVLRPDAFKHLVITEDGSPPMSAQAVRDHIEGRRAATATAPWSPPLVPGQWAMHGIVCVNGGGSGTCFGNFTGVPATTLELISQSGGILGNLDDAGRAGSDPFAALLQELARKVIKGSTLPCDYRIPPPPSSQKFDRDLVNVVYTNAAGTALVFPRADGNTCTDAAAWTYDGATPPTTVRLCPAACSNVQADPGARVDVSFGCQTIVDRPR